MDADDHRFDTQETPIGPAVVGRVVDRTDVDPDELIGSLIELNAALLGYHSNYEREYDYVTVDSTRAYRVADEEWRTLAGEFGFEDGLASAAQFAHTEQARLLFARDVSAHDRFDPDESGVVIGIDTAEVF